MDCISLTASGRYHPMPNSASRHAVDDALQALRQGKMVIVIDPVTAKNEGMVRAAEFATPETINFMLRHGSGSRCSPALVKEIADRLLQFPRWWSGTPLQPDPVSDSDRSPRQARGISTENRSKTIRPHESASPATRGFSSGRGTFTSARQRRWVLRARAHRSASSIRLRLAGLHPWGC
ncbi:MAG: 3,4-dihydroxy-2-butanone-4-phosphate synthase [Planctomycetales bacterium]